LFSVSNYHFGKNLEKGLRAERLVRDAEPSLRIIRNQGRLGRGHERQIIDLGESSVGLYNESGSAYQDVSRMIKNPVFDTYTDFIHGSLEGYVEHAEGIDLANLKLPG